VTIVALDKDSPLFPRFGDAWPYAVSVQLTQLQLTQWIGAVEAVRSRKFDVSHLLCVPGLLQWTLASVPVKGYLSASDSPPMGRRDGLALDGQVLPVGMLQDDPRTLWAREPWEYRLGGRVPRRNNPVKLDLHAPEFDYSWSDEFRSAILAAPSGFNHNTVPLIARYIRRGKQSEFWDDDGIAAILGAFPQHAPRTLELLDRWYPSHPALPPSSYKDLTTWTSQRLLDGFAPLPLQRQTQDEETNYMIEIDWTEECPAGCYETPSVRAKWTKATESGAYELTHVAILRDSPPGSVPGGWWEVARSASKDEEWQHALRVLRGSALLCGQTDVHLSRAHLLVESIALCFEVHFAGAGGEAGRLFLEMLRPFIRDVSGINRLGDALILGPHGVLGAASGLGADALEARLSNQLGMTDWKGFEPRSEHPLDPDNRYVRASRAFWAGVKGFVEKYFVAKVGTEVVNELVSDVAGAIRTHNERPSVPSCNHPTPAAGWEFVWTGEVRSVGSRGAHLSVPATLDEVKQLASFVIYHATFVHGWANDEAWQDGGRLSLAVFGLDALDPPDPGEGARAWLERYGPALRDASMQLSIAWTLDQSRWGVVGRPGQATDLETMDKAQFGEVEVMTMFSDAFETMRVGNESVSPAEMLRDIGRPLETWRCRINT